MISDECKFLFSVNQCSLLYVVGVSEDEVEVDCIGEKAEVISDECKFLFSVNQCSLL